MTIITHSFRRHPRWSSFGSKVSLALLVVVCVFWLRYLDAGGRYNEENRMLSNRTQVGGRIVNVIAPMASVVNMKERYNGSIDTSILAISTGVLELTDWEKERRKEKENLEAERKKKEDARYAQSQMEREKAAEYADKLDNRRSKAELQNAITTKAGEDMSTSSSIVNPSVETTAPPCANLPGSEDILLILKVGATEVYEKLTQHFLTTFLCSPNVIIWSDMSQTIGPYEIHDAISSHSYGVRQDLLSSHQDFESYRKYAEYFSKTQDLGKLKGASGWNLDKWKFLPMVLESYERFPDKKWYIVVEADTYISWTNYLLWTSKLPAEEMVYAGCQVMIGKTIFAHGGSSFLLSNPSLKSLKRIAPDLKAAWENRTSGDCCGDKILSEALQEGGVRPMSVWPMIQGETPTTLDWSERHWCSPALSWHHLSSAEVDALWKFEQEFVTKHGLEKPIRFSDHFEHFVQPHLVDRREDWDNLSKDILYDDKPPRDENGESPFSEKELNAYRTWETCRDLCEDREDCIQYSWRRGGCKLGMTIRLGKVVTQYMKDEDPSLQVISGWMLDRIKAFREKHDPCDEGHYWLTEVPKQEASVRSE